MADTYKIAVEIALAGTIMQGLEAISAKLLGINAKVKDIEGGFGRWATAIAGAAGLLAADKIAGGLEKAVKAGGDLVKQQTLLRNMGVGQSDVMATTIAAQKATNDVIGTTIAENIKGMRELMGVMPNLKEAQQGFPAVMRAAKVLESLTGEPAEHSLQTLAKAIELRGGGINPKTGALDPERFEREAESATRAIIASGGLVNARNLLNMMQQAGPAARGVENADTFYKGILTAMMDMGGFRAGTALTSVGRQLLGGKMTKPTAEEMEQMGLLIPGKWHKSGVGVFVDKGGLTGESILKDSEKGGIVAWMNQVLLPAFAGKGITKSADIQQELYRVFGTETARRLAGLFIQNQSQVKRDANLYDNALGGESYKNVAKGDLGANITNLHDAWQNLMQAFGAPLVKPAIDAMQALAKVGNSFAGWELIHPERVKAVGEALAALSAALAVFGVGAIGAALIALAPAGAFIAGIAGLIAGLSVIAAFNWSSLGPVKEALSGFGQALMAAARIFQIGGEGLVSALKALASTVPAMFSAISAGVSSGVAAIKSAVAEIPKVLATIQSAIANVASELSAAIASIPGKVAGAIAGMASGLASAIGNAIKGAVGSTPGQTPGTGKGVGEGGNYFVPGAYHGGGVGSHTQSASLVPAPRQHDSGTSVADVWMDHQKVGRIMERGIAMNNRSVNSAAGHDGRADWAPPDVAFA